MQQLWEFASANDAGLTRVHLAGGVDRLDAHATSVDLHARPGERGNPRHHGGKGETSSELLQNQCSSLQELCSDAHVSIHLHGPG